MCSHFLFQPLPSTVNKHKEAAFHIYSYCELEVFCILSFYKYLLYLKEQGSYINVLRVRQADSLRAWENEDQY